MPDRDVTTQAGQRRLVEDLGHQAEILVDHHAGAVADRYPGRLLPPVLQRVQPEVGQVGDLLPRGPDAEDTTRVLGAGSLGIKVVAQPAVASGHLPLPLAGLDWPGGTTGVAPHLSAGDHTVVA